MSKTIQIANLDDFVDDRHLARLFAPHGAVHSAKVSTHLTSGQSTGVGLVEMVHDDEGQSAISALHGRRHGERILSVFWREPCGEDESSPRMFKSMNIVEENAPPQADVERRGLP